MLVGVVPEVLYDKPIFRQILDKRRQHVVSGRQLPIRLKFASEGKGRHKLRSGSRHPRHGRLGFVAAPCPAGIDHREDLVAVLQHGHGWQGTECPDGHAGNDDMSAPGTGDQIFEGPAKSRVLVAVDDPGPAIDWLIGEKLLDLRQRVAVLHCAFDEKIRTGILSALAVRARPTMLLRYSARELKSRMSAIRPIWWSMNSMMVLSGVGFS